MINKLLDLTEPLKTMNDGSPQANTPVEGDMELPHQACSRPLVGAKSFCRHAAGHVHDVTYSRLFNGCFKEHSADALMNLASEMMGEGRRDDAKGTPSGVVYLGQFIAHDITRDGTPLNKVPFPTPETTRNERTPLLDLDSVYGSGPVGAAVQPGDYHIYSQTRPGEERFRLGPTEPASVNGVSFPSTDVDFPRRPDKSPIIPDDRNDDNLILAQLHVLFLRFHNKLLDLLVAPASVIPVPNGPTPFAQTRRLVKWHYQWLVREYFLPMVVLQSVLDDIKANGPKLFNPQSAKGLSLPVEFTMAAFRFGHSMVHETYFINEMVALDTREILNRDYRSLSAAHVLDWVRFVGGRAVNLAQKINTTISKSLFGLSDPMVIRYKDNSLPSTVAMLPARSLLRGSKARLPSGQEACALTGTPVLEVDAAHRHYAVLVKNDLLERLPLWYYVLHEAEVAGIDESLSVPSREGGCRLGPLGSRIVAEVLLGLLRVDEDAYPDGWTPPQLPFPRGSSKRITSLGTLAEFVS